MTMRSLLLATAMLAAAATTAFGQGIRDNTIAVPALRANVSISGDVVRIGDVIDNAGHAAQIAIYRAPDLGTVGTLTTAQIIATLRTHHVIGVDTRGLQSIAVTRLSRNIESKELENHVAKALEHRNGLGDATNLVLTFDRDVQSLQLDPSYTGAIDPISSRFDTRTGRFDVIFAINSDTAAPATKLRFTGTAVETLEVAVLARGVERNEVLKASDVVLERRPKSEVGNDGASRDRAVGMQSRRQLRAGQALRNADLSKPDLVVRDQAVTLVYRAPGLQLTVRGKAQESGTEGDVVNVMNLQSKRSVAGVVTGRGEITVSAPSAAPLPGERAPAPSAPEPTASEKISQAPVAASPSPIALAANDRVPVSRKAE
ncbi:flagellar basal body P-ring formation protein FlgA [Tardiphaga alba]|uniref:Flagellar basal body P-ring formation protein FlgA n=1 Tax=Tardiphaga alba TaxID=340268 RepID=A0ABX8ABN5_9BRAD|nr:flagellar basal body P-ring formation chaperone FlgA [Tardiphaga alba]QUS40974.1 flagellar basal body P-ring formation protein FlgA [Tardiphaga alba]